MKVRRHTMQEPPRSTIEEFAKKYNLVMAVYDRPWKTKDRFQAHFELASGESGYGETEDEAIVDYIRKRNENTEAMGGNGSLHIDSYGKTPRCIPVPFLYLATSFVMEDAPLRSNPGTIPVPKASPAPRRA